jgi:hypothetical protein
MPGKHRMITRHCRNCGKAFEIPAYRLKREANPGQWCSMKCRTREGGWNPRPPNPLGLPEQQIAQEYLDGDTLPILADRYSVSMTTISGLLRRNNVKTRPQRGEVFRDPDVRAKAIETSRRRWLEDNPRARKDIPSDEVCAAYARGESAAKIAARFGCDTSVVYDRVRKAGIPVRHAGYTSKIACADEHTADSDWERQIDDWLSAHHIPHEIHPLVPWHRKGARPLWSDFRVGDTYIEVWGITRNVKYEARRAAKLTQYRLHNVDLIEIYPHHILAGDFSSLERLLPSTPTA